MQQFMVFATLYSFLFVVFLTAPTQGAWNSSLRRFAAPWRSSAFHRSFQRGFIEPQFIDRSIKTRVLHVEASGNSASPCSYSDFAAVMVRLSDCMVPFTSWSGHDWSDANSVNTKCSGLCAQQLRGLSGGDRACLAQSSPVTAAIVATMCLSNDGQFCGEPYAGLALMDACPSAADQVSCGQLAGCAWDAASSSCGSFPGATVLSRVCTPCLSTFTDALFEMIQTNLTKQLALMQALDTLCVKQGNTFCAPLIASHPDVYLPGSGGLIDFSSTQLSTLCSQALPNGCFRKANGLQLLFLQTSYLDQLYTCLDRYPAGSQSCVDAYHGNLEVIEVTQAIVDNVCTTREDGAYCMALPRQLRQSDPNFDRCWLAAFETDTPTCSISCRATSFSDSALAAWGCCAGIFHRVLRMPIYAPIPDPRLLTSSSGTTGITVLDDDAVGQWGLLPLENCTPPVNVLALPIGPRRCKSATLSNATAVVVIPLAIAWDRLSLLNKNGTFVGTLGAFLVRDLSGYFGFSASLTANATIRADSSRTVWMNSLIGDAISLVACTLSFTLSSDSVTDATLVAKAIAQGIQAGTVTLPLSSTYVLSSCLQVTGGCVGAGARGILSPVSSSAPPRSELVMVSIVVSLLVVGGL